MLKIAISASFILSSVFVFGMPIQGEELGVNKATKSQYYLIKPDPNTQKRFYYLVKNNDKYSATKLKLIDFKEAKINNFDALRNTYLQVPSSK